MGDSDHVTEAMTVFDESADAYVAFVGAEVSEATEGPIDRSLLQAFVELVGARPGGHLLLAFQEGDGEAVRRLDAQGSGLPLSSYRHSVDDVVDRLGPASLVVHSITRRQPELDHEVTPQAFVFARRA